MKSPEVLYLEPATPNPFNPVTTVTYGIPDGGESLRVLLNIHDVAGRLVRTLVDSRQPPGTHTVTWDGTDSHGNPVASGVYFYRLTWNGESETRRMVLVR